MPTSHDVITLAHRQIGVVADDEPMTADQEAYATPLLEALFEEFQMVQGVTFTWGLTAVPRAALIPLATLVAAEIAGHYSRPAPLISRATGRLRAAYLPDDRPDVRDLDDDGTVSANEADIAKRARYY